MLAGAGAPSPRHGIINGAGAPSARHGIINGARAPSPRHGTIGAALLSRHPPAARRNVSVHGTRVPAAAAMATAPPGPGRPSQAGSPRRVDGSRARKEASGT